MNQDIEHLIGEQISLWELPKKNYATLGQVRMKEFRIGNSTYRVQFNPARILSSAAKVDAHSIQTRKCFLCPTNLPTEQKGIAFGNRYQILVNPYPIFPKHLTIPDLNHTDQRIYGRFTDMLDLAEAAGEYVIFYNGPKCGASAPDHAHFQAGNKGFLPIEREWTTYQKENIVTTDGATLWFLHDNPRTTFIIEATEKQAANDLFSLFYDRMHRAPGEKEPMMNLVAWKENTRWIICLFPRSKHRPACYAAEGERNLLISPASVDMGGVFITPLEKDFDRIAAATISEILEEVCLSPDDSKQLIQSIKKK